MNCPYCGRYNPDNSVYCEGCGRPLKKKSSNSFISNNKFLIIIGGIILLVILGVSAGTLLLNGTNQSYSDGKISFEYPTGFTNNTAPANVTGWEYIGDYENIKGTCIVIGRSTSSGNASDARKSFNDNINSNGNTGNVLSQTNETNPNGISVYTNLYTIKYSNRNDTLKCFDLYFNDKNGLIYYIDVYDVESNYQSVNDTENMIFNSLKLS